MAELYNAIRQPSNFAALPRQPGQQLAALSQAARICKYRHKGPQEVVAPGKIAADCQNCPDALLKGMNMLSLHEQLSNELPKP